LSTSSPNLGEKLTREGTAGAVPPWKQELNERLAATRSRRLRNKEEKAGLSGLERKEGKVESRASRLAAKVAQRYANAPSYSEVFAAEARARARAAASSPALPAVDGTRTLTDRSYKSPESSNGSQGSEAGLTAAVGLEPREAVFVSPEEPGEEAMVAPVEPLAANLIEFPRELVAARKIRPRLAEGPLRESLQEAEHDQAQLKIFEVAAESISQTVTIATPAVDWSPIRLDTDPISAVHPEGLSSSEETLLSTAPLEDRLMAGIFDFALVLAAFALFILVFAACTTHPPTGKPALLGAGLVLAGFLLLYQYLFFKFADGTPGMRYAKIALCTFEDENPTRQAMCRRVFFLFLSAAPLGLGFAWAWFDPDRLGWHDRLSGIYPRSYS
jgi:uncharacterized RDD family membrane protein YckC